MLGREDWREGHSFFDGGVLGGGYFGAGGLEGGVRSSRWWCGCTCPLGEGMSR